MVITGRELKVMREIIVNYSKDSLRMSNRAILINGFIVNGISKFKIKKRLVIVYGRKEKEIARIELHTIERLEIDEEFGSYKFVLKM